jgi:hypothetical protein
VLSAHDDLFWKLTSSLRFSDAANYFFQLQLQNRIELIMLHLDLLRINLDSFCCLSQRHANPLVGWLRLLRGGI